MKSKSVQDVTEQSQGVARGSLRRMVGQHVCDQGCSRPGDLVCQDAMPARKYGPPGMQYDAWVFRYYLCRWHRAAWNKKKMPTQKKMTVLAHKPDAEVLANVRLTDGENQ